MSSRNSSDYLAFLSNKIDENLQLFRYSSTVLGVVGIVILGKSLRVATKFTHVKDIPQKFVNSHVRLFGVVKDCKRDPANTIIVQIEHSPIVKWRNQQGTLPVRLHGVEASDPGIQWLQQNLYSRNVSFRILTVLDDSNVIPSLVYTKKNWFRKILVNEYLVKEGLCRAAYPSDETLLQDRFSTKLTENLVKYETTAEKKGKGLWKKPSLKSRFQEWKKDKQDTLIQFLPFKKKQVKETPLDRQKNSEDGPNIQSGVEKTDKYDKNSAVIKEKNSQVEDKR